MRVRLKGINSKRKRLADGSFKTYYWAWKGGPALRGQPGTPEFIASYNEAVARKVTPPRGSLLTPFEAISGIRGLSLAPPSPRGAARALFMSHSRAILGDSPLSAPHRSGRRRRIRRGATRSPPSPDVGRPTMRGRCWPAHSRGASIAGWSSPTHASAAGGCIAALALRKSGPTPTRPCSSNAPPRTCICHFCSHYGPDSGKAIYYASLGRPTTESYRLRQRSLAEGVFNAFDQCDVAALVAATRKRHDIHGLYS